MSTGSPEVIVYVVDSLGLSGKTRSLVSLVCRLDRRHFSPVVCRLSDEPSPLVDDLSAAAVPLHTITCRAGLHPATALRIARYGWSVKASIFHCYNPRPMLYGGVAARAIGVLATVGSLSAFACHVPNQTYDFLPQPLSTISRRNVYRNRLAAATMQFLVSVSPRLGRSFCEYNRVPLAKLRVIPYGADIECLEGIDAHRVEELRQTLGFSGTDLVIGSVGRLVEQKDYPMQLRAFALAVAQIPSLRMVIAGDGPLRASLEHIARDLGVADRVRFLGHCAEVPALLGSLDLFVLASKFEPFGVALLEAKAAALPIVATAVNEIPDIIDDGRTGLLTRPGDAASLATAIVKLAGDPELRARLGRNARSFAAQHTLAINVAAHERLYEAALRRPSPKWSGQPVRT